MAARAVTAYGLALTAAATIVLVTWTNPLTVALALAGSFFYVVVYTVLLKRRTVQNIVIGGAAGAVPVLVGWAAVTGTLEAPAWLLFAVVFCWTPAHFWALALRYRDDYAAAGFPMLPVVKGERYAATQILGDTVIVVALSLTLPLVASVGVVYVAAAAAWAPRLSGRGGGRRGQWPRTAGRDSRSRG